jgi:SAM-dependent methyltransferase
VYADGRALRAAAAVTGREPGGPPIIGSMAFRSGRPTRAPERRSVAPLAVIVGLALVVVVGRRLAQGSLARLRTSSSPSVALYDRVLGAILEGAYRQVATDAAAFLESRPAPEVLEIGPGPGRLAIRLARRHPGLRLVGLDIDPAMVARATARSRREGLGGRVRFVVGDVAAIPFDDGSFDLVVSTFSAHHWGQAARAIAEIERVLRPGGRAMIYDLPELWLRLERGARRVADVSRGREATEGRVAWPSRHLSLLRLIEFAPPWASGARTARSPARQP